MKIKEFIMNELNNYYQHNSKIIFIKIYIIISIFISFTLNYAETRYVNKTGSSIPPYTSWETASDSIQKCINISITGDTIYVASGIYKEKIVIENKYLTIIGSGWDSCVIDSRDLEVTTGFYAFDVEGDIILKGFNIKVSNFNTGENSYKGTGFAISNASHLSIVENNKIENCYKGSDIFNSNIIFKNNIIVNVSQGIRLEAFNENYYPVIDSNIIITAVTGFAVQGIVIGFGTSSYIRNNIIINENTGDGMYPIINPKELKNNLVIQKGINNTMIDYLGYYLSLGNDTISNNLLVSSYSKYGYILFRGNKKIINNNSIGAQTAYSFENVDTINFKYNNAWKSESPFSGFTADSTNLEVDPMFVNEDSSDFHLQKYSPLIDRGDSSILDKDGSRSDIGLYGGILGENYIYMDLAPRAPVNLTAMIDSEKIIIKWNRNTEADFNHYNIYSDTTTGFIINSSKLISTQSDTFFIQAITQEKSNLYYKLTAADNQDNISESSEELAIILTTVISDPSIINNYELFQNYPNPFNPSTIISFRMKERGYVKLAVYDIKGELIEYLVNEEKETGYYEIDFSTKNRSKIGGNANELASGIYLYKIDIMNHKQIPVFSEIKKMIYLK